jgi:hypothetical protein
MFIYHAHATNGSKAGKFLSRFLTFPCSENHVYKKLFYLSLTIKMHQDYIYTPNKMVNR